MTQPIPGERDELWFCSGCHTYTDSPETGPEADERQGDPVCPNCAADKWYFDLVETHGAFTEDESAKIIAEYKRTGVIP